MINWLPLVWAGIIAFCILMYVILDGFTLGTGILMPFMDEDERNIAVSMLLPTWDGNQTWLVLGGATFYGAFPLAFGIILPILYLPLLLMVLALLFRGVVFEFRLKAGAKSRARWDRCFILSSILATVVQGIVLGAFIYGFNNLALPYSSFLWSSTYAFLTGIALVFGYALLGATRLILKTEGALQQKMRVLAKSIAFIIAFFLVAVSIYTPFINPLIAANWFSLNRIWLLILMPVLTGCAWFGLIISLRKNNEILPFWFSVCIFCCCFAGFAIGTWPNIVPHSISIWQAAAPDNSLQFMLYGASVMIPFLLAYTGYAYKIFSGKAKDVFHY